ncbi:hypothetical protein Pelo_6992 [Pelomyxa schiedti]|nr:hypothetical protein Pelo_6992 [Pelomyxa schiedti]
MMQECSESWTSLLPVASAITLGQSEQCRIDENRSRMSMHVMVDLCNDACRLRNELWDVEKMDDFVCGLMSFLGTPVQSVLEMKNALLVCCASDLLSRVPAQFQELLNNVKTPLKTVLIPPVSEIHQRAGVSCSSGSLEALAELYPRSLPSGGKKPIWKVGSMESDTITVQSTYPTQTWEAYGGATHTVSLSNIDLPANRE